MPDSTGLPCGRTTSIIVTLGNIVGALFFVGMIYWVAFRKEIAALK